MNRFDPVQVPIDDALVEDASRTRCLSGLLVCFAERMVIFLSWGSVGNAASRHFALDRFFAIG